VVAVVQQMQVVEEPVGQQQGFQMQAPGSLV
jgi:hypothetical protein